MLTKLGESVEAVEVTVVVDTKGILEDTSDEGV